MAEFPEDADSVAVVLGKERMLAADFWGGKMIYITPDQLLAGLLKSGDLKTLNGNSLVGVGDIIIKQSKTGLIEPWTPGVPTDQYIARTKLIDGQNFLFISMVANNLSEPMLNGAGSEDTWWLTGGPPNDQDLSGLVVKVPGKSLISDTEIERLSKITAVEPPVLEYIISQNGIINV